jgi:drug/metabolite transporter (DMT)-like permease
MSHEPKTGSAPAVSAAVPPPSARSAWARHQHALSAHAAGLSVSTRALLWAAASGLLFCLLNTLARTLSSQLDPMQTQFLRYFFGLVVLLPWVLRHGLAAYRPKRIGGQFLRGAVHTLGLILWFVALPKIPLADMTAIGFTGPLFIMIGAYFFLKEPMRWERWLATVLGFVGVLVVVAPQLSGSGGFYHLVMLASAPIFAASFLLTKALTRTESAGVIVLWQSLTVTLLSLPLALPVWQAVSGWQWLAFALAGVLGTGGHYCLTRAYVVADISATQSLRFLDLVWAALLGYLVFADVPTTTTLAGGAIICAATLWVARRESRALPTTDESP